MGLDLAAQGGEKNKCIFVLGILRNPDCSLRKDNTYYILLRSITVFQYTYVLIFAKFDVKCYVQRGWLRLVRNHFHKQSS